MIWTSIRYVFLISPAALRCSATQSTGDGRTALKKACALPVSLQMSDERSRQKAESAMDELNWTVYSHSCLHPDAKCLKKHESCFGHTCIAINTSQSHVGFGYVHSIRRGCVTHASSGSEVMLSTNTQAPLLLIASFRDCKSHIFFDLFHLLYTKFTSTFSYCRCSSARAFF